MNLKNAMVVSPGSCDNTTTIFNGVCVSPGSCDIIITYPLNKSIIIYTPFSNKNIFNRIIKYSVTETLYDENELFYT